jgi:hypothetical protein
VENPPHRHWDVAPLILIGVALGLLGSRWETTAGAVLSLAGFALLVFGLVRWTRRGRLSPATPVEVDPVSAVV